MNFQPIRLLASLVASIVLAGFIGYSIAVESYQVIVFLGAFAILLFAIIRPGYTPLLALGLLSPFNLPIPLIRGFPFLLMILAICLFKYILHNWLTHRQKGPKSIIPWAFTLFFVWIVLRFCLTPAMPNLSGFGENVTGFRAYLNYGLCLGSVWFVCKTVQTKGDIVRLVRALAGISAFFVALLIPLMFTKSMTVAHVITVLGAYVTSFDNGILRFVVLPSFGLILATLALLPTLLPVNRYYRIGMLAMGIAAVVLGGNRSSVLMLFAIFCVVPLLKRRLVHVTVGISITCVCLAAFYFIGQNIKVRDFGMLRVLALTSKRVAANTDAQSNVEWRKVRWARAMEEIRNKPWIGRGYGGLENAFVWGNWQHFGDASVEIDIASGGIHNGYLACALALGIPAAVFFIGLFGWQIWINGRRSLELRDKDPFISETHALVCASLVAFALTIYIGTDVNSPLIWFYFALGLVAHRLGAAVKADSAKNTARASNTFRVKIPQTAALPVSCREIHSR